MHHNDSQQQKRSLRLVLEIFVLTFLLGFSISKIQQSSKSDPSQSAAAIQTLDADNSEVDALFNFQSI